jgi:hypothetical protein
MSPRIRQTLVFVIGVEVDLLELKFYRRLLLAMKDCDEADLVGPSQALVLERRKLHGFLGYTTG